MNPADIRRAIGVALSGLDCEIYDLANLSPSVPAIMIYPTQVPATDSYTTSYELTFELLLLASSVEMESGQDTLDAWLSSDDPESVSAALNADPTLGGVVQSTRCQGILPNSYAVMPLVDGGTNYLTARVAVDVLT